MAVTDPPTVNKKSTKDTADHSAIGTTSGTAPSAAVVLDILKASDHCKQQEQAMFLASGGGPATAPAASSPARTVETIQTRPVASEDGDIEKQITPLPSPNRKQPDARSVSSISTGGSATPGDGASGSGGKKRVGGKKIMKNIVPKGIRKQGRRLFHVVKNAAATTSTTATSNGNADDGDQQNEQYDHLSHGTAAAVANEATPLVVASGSNQSRPPTTTTATRSSTLSPEKKARVVTAWKQLEQKVKSGDFLLETTGIGSGDGVSGFSNHRSPADLNDMDTSQHSAAYLDLERRKAQEAIQSGLEFSVWQCLAAMILYMGVAVFAFKFFLEPSWTVIDSMYFAMVTFTTIGYGDLSPHNHLGRVFTVIYALSGVACLGIALGVLGNSVIEAQNQAAEKTKELAEKRVISLFSSDDDDDDDDDRNNGVDNNAASNESAAKEQPKEEEKVQRPFVHLAKEFAFVFIILLVFACLMVDDPGMGDTDHWDIINAIYYAIITASTVGYGDFAPKSQRGRLIAMVYIPLAVGAMGHFLGMLASVIMDAKQDAFRKEMQRKELTYQDLEIMDVDGSGTVSQAEFIEFMLVAMNKVDQEFMDELRSHFNRLDTDGTGYLCKGDLVHNARKKLKTSAKKMELKAYKEKLLAQSAEAAKKRQHEQEQRIGERYKHNKKHASFFQLALFEKSHNSTGDHSSIV